MSVPTSTFSRLGRVITCGRRVSTADGEAEGLIVGVGVGVGVGVDVGVGLAEGEVDGVATFTPLFHTSLLPDLMQVYLIPDAVLVELSLVQAEPGLIAAFEEAVNCVRSIDIHNIAFRRRLMGKL